MPIGRTSSRTDTRPVGQAQTGPYKTYKWEVGDRLSVQDLGRVWNGGGGSDGKANAQVGQYYGYAQAAGQQTANAWNDYWRAGSDVYGKRTTRLLDPVGDFGKPQYPGRKGLMIEKQNEGKQDLTAPPEQMTAEQSLELQKNRNKFKGRASLPATTSQNGGATTISVNITPGVSGLNFG